MAVQRIGQAAWPGSQRCLMKDNLHASDELTDNGRISYVAGVNLNLVLKVSQFGSAAGDPIVEDANFMARRQQGFYQMCPDEASSSRDQTNCHEQTPLAGETNFLYQKHHPVGAKQNINLGVRRSIKLDAIVFTPP
jgi:hypothetical protein